MHSAFRMLQIAFLSIECGALREIDFNFGGSISWNTQRNCVAFHNRATEPPPPPFLRLLFGSGSDSLHRDNTMHHICSPIEICNTDTRDDAKNSQRGLCNFHQGDTCTIFEVFFQMDCLPQGGLLVEDFSHSSSAIEEYGQVERVNFPRSLSSRRKLLSHTFLLLSH